jgi:hypothetical protein
VISRFAIANPVTFNGQEAIEIGSVPVSGPADRTEIVGARAHPFPGFIDKQTVATMHPGVEEVFLVPRRSI